MSVARSSEPIRVRIPAAPVRTTSADAALAPLVSSKVQSWRAGETIARESSATPELWVLVSGWAARTRILSDGRRQITRIMLAGDVGPSPTLNAPGSTIVAITPVKTASLGTLRELLGSEELPRAEARNVLQRLADEEQAELFDHIVRLGRMSAYERTADMILELFGRLARKGQIAGETMPLPLTQELLADFLGLSIVHVNRTLQQLRRKGLIVLRAGQLRILDLAALAAVCGRQPILPLPAAEPRSFAGRDRASISTSGG